MRNKPLVHTLIKAMVPIVMMASASQAYASIELENATPVNNISSSSELKYTIDVPQGASDLNFSIAGGSGDADLYVRYGAEPTSSSFDCRPYLSGNDESCAINNVQVGTYYISIEPYTAFSGVTLLASYSEDNTPPPPPADELNESNLSGQTGSEQTFTLAVPEGASNLKFEMTGSSGDADLYVKFGSQPTSSSYDCRPYIGGSNETCNIANVQTGTYYVMIKAYSSYSGVSLIASYDTTTNPGNTSPIAVIANGPFNGVTGSPIAFSSSGSNDPDGSIVSYSWSFGDSQSSSLANPNHTYTAPGTYTVTLTVTDDQNATHSVNSQAVISAASSGFSVASHYYDKGTFDHFYTNYEQAFSDNYTDDDVEIHAYIVINFNANVDQNSVSADSITVKRMNMSDNSENNQNLINGEIEWLDADTLIFKPNVSYYTNPNGMFDWNHPSWNGLKPNYEYAVNLSGNIKSTTGAYLDVDNENASWVFKTIDTDYGLYWFKDGISAMKYVPGRSIPSDYYDPSKPTHIYGHGWAKTSVHVQSGALRDYRREGFVMNPGSMYPSQQAVDLVSVWKDPSKNYEGKAWNFGVVYWNQFADDDYANLSKPQMAEAKIWSTNGKNKMSYAIRKWSGSSWSQDHVETHAPLKPISVVLADAVIAATNNTANGELRLSGHSLGNQVVTGISYILKKEYAEGRISAKQFPKRLALLDPYWRDGALQNSWTENHPAYVDLGASNDSAGQMTNKIVKDIIDFADQDPSVSFVAAHYDTSRTTDGSFFGQSFGDKNLNQRDVTATIYLQASWINGNEGDRNYYSHRHVNGRYWYLWQYAYAPPATGFSASSSAADIRANMNYYLSNKIRYSISSGGSTPNPSDDNYELKTGSSWQQ